MSLKVGGLDSAWSASSPFNCQVIYWWRDWLLVHLIGCNDWLAGHSSWLAVSPGSLSGPSRRLTGSAVRLTRLSFWKTVWSSYTTDCLAWKTNWGWWKTDGELRLNLENSLLFLVEWVVLLEDQLVLMKECEALVKCFQKTSWFSPKTYFLLADSMAVLEDCLVVALTKDYFSFLIN